MSEPVEQNTIILIVWMDRGLRMWIKLGCILQRNWTNLISIVTYFMKSRWHGMIWCDFRHLPLTLMFVIFTHLLFTSTLIYHMCLDIRFHVIRHICFAVSERSWNNVNNCVHPQLWWRTSKVSILHLNEMLMSADMWYCNVKVTAVQNSMSDQRQKW